MGVNGTVTSKRFGPSKKDVKSYIRIRICVKYTIMYCIHRYMLNMNMSAQCNQDAWEFNIVIVLGKKPFLNFCFSRI